jgi:hypothetical protein
MTQVTANLNSADTGRDENLDAAMLLRLGNWPRCLNWFGNLGASLDKLTMSERPPYNALSRSR